MIKSYPGFGPLFLILFSIVIGITIVINNDNFGWIFMVIGVAGLFTLKIIKTENDKIIIRQIFIGKLSTIYRSQILKISILDPGYSIFSTSEKRYRYVRLIIEFEKDSKIKRITVSPPFYTSFNKFEKFIRKNYSELINE